MTACQQESLRAEDFPLTTDFTKKDYAVGEAISFTATIKNQSGKDVSLTTNGKMPCAYLHLQGDSAEHAEVSQRVEQTFRAGETVTRGFSYVPEKACTYILDIHYTIEVDGVAFEKKLDEIEFFVK